MLTLQQIQQLMPSNTDLLSSYGLTYAGEAEDGTPRYMDSNGSLVSQGMLQDYLGNMGDFTKTTLANNGILEMPAYTASDWARVNELNNVNYATPEAYFDQLYGDGQMVDNYFVLPENNKQGAYVGTPIAGEFDTGFLQDFIKNAAIMGGAAFGMNALSGALAPTAGTAAAGTATSGTSLLPELGSQVSSGAIGEGLGSSVINSYFPAATELAGGVGAGTSGALGAGLSAGGSLLPELGAQTGLGAIGENLGSSVVNSYFPEAANLTGTMTPTAGGVASAVNAASNVANAAGTAGSAAAPAGSAMSRILDGTATTADWTSVLGTLGTTGLGLLGANSQADAMKDISTQYLNMGQPYRDKLNASYQPGFNLATADPAFQGALDTAAQAAARATSAKVGNPVGNPGAYSEMQKWITDSVTMPALQNYRSQLGTFGQLGTNVAGTASLNSAQANGSGWEALGYGVENLFNPKKSIFDNQQFKGLLGNNKMFSF